jgi:short-subunit dehydrogenase
LFQDKVAIVTGASSGLGAVLAEELAKAGVQLALFARREEKLVETAQRCRSLGVRVVTVVGDVTVVDDCKRLVTTAVAEFGRVDYLMANAGISMWARFEDIEDVAVFRKLMETNYLGVVNGVHAVLPELKKVGGMIVAISSIQGKIGVPLHTGYVASKHAVLGFFEALRMELDGSGVDILTVLPHWLRGTDLRQSAFGKDGEALGKSSRSHSKESITLEDCSVAILKAMKKRKRELVIPWKLRALPWLNLINPKIVAWLVKGKVTEQDQ